MIPLLPNYVKNGGVFTLSGNLTSSSQALGILFGEDDPHCEDFCLLANFPNGGGPYITFTAKDATWVAHYNGEILEAKLGFALEIGFVNFESMGKHSFPSINALVVPGVRTLELSTDDHWAEFVDCKRGKTDPDAIWPGNCIHLRFPSEQFHFF